MTPQDREIATFLLSGEHSILATLREQWAMATVTKRASWSYAHTIWMDLPPGLPTVFHKGFARIDDVWAEVTGLSTPAQLQLGIRDGRIESFSGKTSNDELWPEDARIVRCYYTAGPEGTSESATRNLSWALREVLERQAEPVRPFLDELPEPEEFWALGDRLIPDYGPAETVQGEVLRAAMRVCSEYFRNGSGNWAADPQFFGGLVTFLLVHLCDGTFEEETDGFVQQLLGMVRAHGECDYELRSPADERILNRDLDKLEQVATAWCLRHPDLISYRSPDAASCGRERAEPGAAPDIAR